MAGFRTLISGVLLACAVVIAWFGLALNGYKEEFASKPAHTLWWAIPWTVTTVVLGVLVLGSIFDRTRRPRWSWFALGFALAMALTLAVLWIVG